MHFIHYVAQVLKKKRNKSVTFIIITFEFTVGTIDKKNGDGHVDTIHFFILSAHPG
jgi:hypothetical protein